MAKVFAVIRNEFGELELLNWSSVSAFARGGGDFTDDRYICIGTTREYIEYGIYKKPHKNPECGYFGVVLDDESLKANHMICAAFSKHFNKN